MIPSEQTANLAGVNDSTQERRDAPDSWERALDAIEWDALDEQGWVRISGLLEAEDCRELIARFDDDCFERTIEMEPKGYGVGSYRYWNRDAPSIVDALVANLYARLRERATAWRSRWGDPFEYPDDLPALWERCRAGGQRRRSSILLRYPTGGVNHPHRDLYGEVWFPYQALVGLSSPDSAQGPHDYDGGTFYLLEEDAGTTRKTSVRLERGDMLVFSSRARFGLDGPIDLQHGMDPVTRGERFALGLVMNLAE